MKVLLHHVGLAVGDVDATIDALEAALGAVRLPAPAAGHQLVRVGDLRLALVDRRDSDPSTRAWGDHVALAISGSRAPVIDRLAAKGWLVQDVRDRAYARNGDGSLTLELLMMDPDEP